MRLSMHRNSLFALLLRSPWWISFVVAIGLFAVARLFVPEIYAVVVPIPILVVGCVAAWRQLRAPSAARVAQRLEALRAMSWREFAAALESAYQRKGYAVKRLSGDAADFELRREGERTLVSAKRWKAARTGIEPLRELAAAGGRDAVIARLYIAAGDSTDQARAFASGKGIRIVEGAELAALLPPA
jgi:restriction system protein